MMGRAGGNSHCQAISTAEGWDALWGCHCHARGEHGTGKTGNETPSDTHSVPVTIQRSAVQPILSPVSFRYALIQPSRQENPSDAESRL